MKKLLCFCFTLSLLLLSAVITVSAEPVYGTHGDNLTWVYDNGTLTISGSGEMSSVQIYPWNSFDESTHTLIIDPGITTISRHAFHSFYDLTSVSLPDSVYKIGEGAFAYCHKLTSAPLSSSITQIDKYAFNSCSSITSLSIPSSITQISYGAFQNCKSIASLTIPDSVTYIDSYAFYDCRSLTTVTIPDSVTVIDGIAFSGCTSLQSIQLSRNLQELGGNAFQDCKSLKSISIPDGVTKIGGYAFHGCTALESIYIGVGVSSIADSAFWKCPSLSAFSVSPSNPYFCTDRGVLYNKSKTELVRMPQGFQGSYSILPGTVKVLEYACYECQKLTSLSTPSSLRMIDDYAIDNCDALQTVSFAHGLETIGLHGFFSCNALGPVTFPSSLTKIGISAFYYCTSMTEMYFSGIAPMLEHGCFSGVTATLYYPKGKAGWGSARGSAHQGKITWVAVADGCADGHTPVDVPQTAPTCTVSGLTAGQQCSKCGTIMAGQTKIPPLGHKFGAWTQTTAPTETTEGLAQRTCLVCNAQEEKTIPKRTPAPQPTEPVTTEPPDTQPPVTEPMATEPDITVPENTKPQPTQPAATSPAETAPGSAASTQADSDSTQKPQDQSIWFYIVVSAAVSGIIVSALLQMLQKRKSK